MSKPWSFSSLLSLRCPACNADSFRAGLFRTAKVCSRCGQVFERESGFFAGAIYPFYGMAAALGGGAIVLSMLLFGASFRGGMIVGGILVALASPWLFWLSRLAFLHTDHRFFQDEA